MVNCQSPHPIIPSSSYRAGVAAAGGESRDPPLAGMAKVQEEQNHSSLVDRTCCNIDFPQQGQVLTAISFLLLTFSDVF